MNHIALYYPFIHIKDDDWLKVAALYWDRVGRIVPAGFKTHDSHVAAKLAADGFLFDLTIGRDKKTNDAIEEIGADLVRLTILRGDELRSRYAIASKEAWPDDPTTVRNAPKGSDPKLAYVFAEK